MKPSDASPACEAFLARLDGLGLFHMDLSLARMAEFARRATQLAALPRLPLLHVVGTNGKGSTATILAELLQAHGVPTGLYTSPHFITPRERILVDGAMPPEDAFARLGAHVFALGEGLGLTYFEILTGLAMLAFAEAGCGAAVMEAGLGGRYDATSVFEPGLTVFTPIGLDHLNVLGSTLAAIAADKADAMRPGGLAVTADQEPAALAVLRARAVELGARLLPAGELLSYDRASGRLAPGPLGQGWIAPQENLALGLLGLHQQENARTALAAFHLHAREHGIPVRPEACRRALARAFIPGRMQPVEDAPGLPPRLLLDGGHNAHGLAALAASLRAAELRPGAVVFGCLRDKPLADMLPLVRSLAGEGRLVACGIPSCPRACAPEELAALLGPGAEPAPDVHAALDRLGQVQEPVLVAGSLYLLGEFYTKHPWLLARRAAG